jgi:hypothetical protein
MDPFEPNCVQRTYVSEWDAGWVKMDSGRKKRGNGSEQWMAKGSRWVSFFWFVSSWKSPFDPVLHYFLSLHCPSLRMAVHLY